MSNISFFSRRVLLLLLFTLITNTISAQFYTAGNDPTVKWSQIKTEHYTFIFPRGMDLLARSYAMQFEGVRPAVMEPLEINPKHIPVVLHPYTNKSNGVVTWAPKRVDLMTTPIAYENYSQPWDLQLALHESRHIGQVSHYENGAFKYLNWIFGEQITGLGVGLLPTKVFLEGDAVVAETELSNSGRGRNADFLQYVRASLLEGNYRTWEQLQFGSYRNYSTDVYVMGYMVNSYMRHLTNNYFYPSLYAGNSVRKLFNIPYQFGVYKHLVGMNKPALIKATQDYFADIWRADYAKRGEFTKSNEVKEDTDRLYTDYRWPIMIRDKRSKYYGSIIAIKEGVEHSRVMVAIDSCGKERVLRPFNVYSSPLNISPKGLVYWSETTSHEAGQLEDFSELKTYDLERGRHIHHIRGTRYFNPSISATGDTITVVEYPEFGSSYLVLMNSNDENEIIERIEAPDKGQLKESLFVGDDIYCTIIKEYGIALYKYSKGEWIEVIPQHNRTMVGLKGYGETIYFTSDLDGVNNIYSYNTKSAELKALTNSKYGASDPYYDPSEGVLYYSEYSTKGYKLSKNLIADLKGREMDFKQPYSEEVAQMLTSQARAATKLEEMEFSTEYLDSTKYPTKNYNKLTHLFRFHSWAPFYYNIDNIKSMSYDSFYNLASLGATIYSQNTHGTAVTMVGYSYHKGFHSGHFKFTSDDLPISFELSADINDRNRVSRTVRVEEGKVVVDRKEMYGSPYFHASALAYMPMSYTSGGWNRGFVPQVKWYYSNDPFYVQKVRRFRTKSEIHYGLSYYRTLSIPTMAIFPRWGFNLSYMGSFAPLMGENFGSMSYLYGYLYLPGIARSQGIKLTAQFQKQFMNGKAYLLGSYASLPRGYEEEMPFVNYKKFTFDYAAPIWLGDINIGSVLYLQRLQLIPFADYAIADINTELYSFGSDLMLDCHVLRLGVPFSIGVRYARTGMQEGNRNYVKFLFSIKGF